MCNHTTILFEQIGATGERSAQAGNESKQIEQAAEDFLRDARDLHDKVKKICSTVCYSDFKLLCGMLPVKFRANEREKSKYSNILIEYKLKERKQKLIEPYL